MKFKPYPIFGTAMVIANAEAGEKRETVLGDDGLVTSGYYYVTKGCIKTKIKETGQSLEDRVPGWLNIEQVPPVNSDASANLTLELSFEDDTEWVCIAYKFNKAGLPELESFIVDPGETMEFKNDSNLFLVRGKLQIKTKTFTGPCTIRVRSGDCIATSLYEEKSYGLIVK
jgi:hypothetical protein